MARAQPTQLTLKECRERGYHAYVCEKWVPGANIRKDAFGFGDLLVIDDDQGSLLIQACVYASIGTRRQKILEKCTEPAKAWLERGNRIEIWAWRKVGHRWQLTDTPIELGDFE